VRPPLFKEYTSPNPIALILCKCQRLLLISHGQYKGGENFPLWQASTESAVHVAKMEMNAQRVLEKIAQALAPSRTFMFPI
jgi:hypothetical protein